MMLINILSCIDIFCLVRSSGRLYICINALSISEPISELLRFEIPNLKKFNLLRILTVNFPKFPESCKVQILYKSGQKNIK